MSKTITFRFAGFGGQGALLMGMMLTYSGMQEERHVTWLLFTKPCAFCHAIISLNDLI